MWGFFFWKVVVKILFHKTTTEGLLANYVFYISQCMVIYTSKDLDLLSSCRREKKGIVGKIAANVKES